MVIMSFWYRLKDFFRRYMTGRNGVDRLASDVLIASILIHFLALIFYAPFLDLLGKIGCLYVIFRILSRNVSARYAENSRYCAFRTRMMADIAQFFVRVKNSGKYKYFRCPQCNSRLRLPRKVGEVTVTCGKCKHAFRKKA